MNLRRNTLSCLKPTLLLAFSFLTIFVHAQMVTGVWHGKINKQNVEVKIIKNGDSITGTSYYYTLGSHRRYSIKGYFDEKNNQVIWWDDQLIEEKTSSIFSPGKVPLLSRADFNCPGSGVMLLDGSSNEKNEEIKEGSVHLQKTLGGPKFPDEWDWVIDNFTVGTNDPDIIDSISLIAFHPTQKTTPQEPPVAMNKKPATVVIPPVKEKKVTTEPTAPVVVSKPQKTIEEKFTSRQKKVFTTIPVSGDSITLYFYDNAIVDGDSISLFLDGKMIFTHLRLASKPHVVKIAVADLKQESELVMVAENLGEIPPNTSYMEAVVGDKNYSANLASTEESSAVIMLRK